MSSKVVHLSTEAHTKAKSFCKSQGLKMSDWVASLIEAAIANGGQPAVTAAPMAVPAANQAARMAPPRQPATAVAPAARPAAAPKPAHSVVSSRESVAERPSNPPDGVKAFVPKKKALERYEETANDADELPPWAAPPFWAQNK